MQIIVHTNSMGHGHLGTSEPNTLLLARFIKAISNTPNMRKNMLQKTATSTNSNNNDNENHRITVILALCKLTFLIS